MSTALKENTRYSVTGHSHRRGYDSTSEYAGEADPLTCKFSAALLTFVECLFMDDNYLGTESVRNHHHHQ